MVGQILCEFAVITTVVFLHIVTGFLVNEGNSTPNALVPTKLTTVTAVPPTLHASTQTTETPTAHSLMATTTHNVVCKDTIHTCSQYGREACTNNVYEAWARAHCAMYCGFCTPAVPLPELCQDRLHNCAEYDSGDLCTDSSFYTWAYDNCRGYCKFDMCNESWCEDSKDANCPLLDSALNLCADKEKAKTICRKYCNLCDFVDGQWCSWSSWSSCDTSCGNGTEVRTRQCSCPAPASGGRDCVGDGTNSVICSKNPCPVNGGWGSWTPWTSCSVSCGIGMRKRKRSCDNPLPSLYGDHCFGENVDFKVCANAMCYDGNWTSWAEWSACSQTCGFGQRHRNRTCATNNLLLQDCNGSGYQYDTCDNTSCAAIDGGWSSWSTWSACSSTTCSKQRTRTCNRPRPSLYGKTCLGNNIDKTNCDLTACSYFPLRIRLRDGSSSHRGRIEVSLDGSNWGTVCDDSFDSDSAKVACRMLGYPTSNARVDTSVSDGSSSMPIYLDDVSCIGTENSLLLCNHNAWLHNNCGHWEDVGVICA